MRKTRQANLRTFVNQNLSANIVDAVIDEDLIPKAKRILKKTNAKIVYQRCSEEVKEISDGFITMLTSDKNKTSLSEDFDTENISAEFFVKINKKPKQVKKKKTFKHRTHANNISINVKQQTHSLHEKNILNRWNSLSTINLNIKDKMVPLQQSSSFKIVKKKSKPNAQSRNSEITEDYDELERLFRQAKISKENYLPTEKNIDINRKTEKKSRETYNTKKNGYHTTDYFGNPLTAAKNTNIKHFIDVQVQILDCISKKNAHCELLSTEDQKKSEKKLKFAQEGSDQNFIFSRSIQQNMDKILKKNTSNEQNDESSLIKKQSNDFDIINKNKQKIPAKISFHAFQKLKKLNQQQSMVIKSKKQVLEELTNSIKPKNIKSLERSQVSVMSQKISNQITLSNVQGYQFLLGGEDKKSKKKNVRIHPSCIKQ